jgi:hypothetical protein
MTERTRNNMLRWVRKAQFYLQGQSDFFEDEEARGLYVVLLATEGAIEFDDVIELGLHVAEFCKRKQLETSDPTPAAPGDDAARHTP